jgi:arsenate reductase
MYTVYGIPNCDTVKKARTWLDSHKIPYDFHNYKTDGITTARLKKWSGQVGWEIILNKKGTTWRALDEPTKASINTEKKAIQLLAENTSAIKRPVIEKGDEVIVVGFDVEAYEKLFGK